MSRSGPVTEIIKDHQRKPPVNVGSLAHALGLKLYSSSLPDNVSGMIRRDAKLGGSSGYAVFVNASHSITRQRFTVAHEIAHFILHKDKIGDGLVEDALLRAATLSNSLERQANAMAADILMPWTLIEDAMANGVITIEGLASLFEVSRDAMSYRVLGVSYNEVQATGRSQVA